MQNIMAWTTVALVLTMGPALLIFAWTQTFSRKPVEEKYKSSAHGGLGGAFDSVWSPTAHEAGLERDRQTQRTVPAPSPSDPANTIDNNRIVIHVE